MATSGKTITTHDPFLEKDLVRIHRMAMLGVEGVNRGRVTSNVCYLSESKW